MLDVIDNISAARIDKSSVHGYGLYCTRDLNEGEFLADLNGQVVPWELHERKRLTEEWNALPGNFILARPYKTKYYYINHSREPNLKVVRDSDDKVSITTLRFIKEGEELFLDYREEPLAESYLKGHGATYL